MARVRWFAHGLLAGALLCPTAGWAQNPVPEVRIVQPIDESRLTTLQGTMHPLANARNDRGAAPDGMPLERMHLVLKRSASQDAALRQLIGEMHTPGSASYHKWLTPEEFGKRFGPSDQDIATVETWLTGHGFNVVKVNEGKQTIEISGNVAQMRAAFHTQIHRYEVKGETHYANASDPRIPAALAPVVGGFVTLNNFRVKNYAKQLGKALYDPKTGTATPEWTIGGNNSYNFVLAPQDFAVQYDLAPLYSAGIDGSGQTLAIINDSNVNMQLVNEFRNLFGLEPNTPQVIIDGNDPGVDGINNPEGPNYDSVEAYLDVEWSGAVAPNATVDLVVAGDTALEAGLYLAMEHAVYGNVAPVMSLSFGECEKYLGGTNQFMSNLWEQAAAQGITVMVSAGDAGSAGCDDDDTQEFAVNGVGVNGLGSTPYNVSVGGTDFYYSDFSQGLGAMEDQILNYWGTTVSNNRPAKSILGVIPEQPWNDSQYGLTLGSIESEGSSLGSTNIVGGGGGASIIYKPKPLWQAGKGVPADGVRDLPDVSLFAANGANASYYPICAEDGDCQPVASDGAVQFYGVGGTSASSPAFAGIMALVNQKYGRQGQAGFVLYPLAAQFPAAFHDVTAGTNSVPCSYSPHTPDCIAVSDPATVTDPALGTATEGQIGTGTTPDYNATAGYDMASGLGSVDANVLVSDWNKVTLASTTTTLTPSKTNFTHGTAITVSGGVTSAGSTPAGEVALMTDSTQLMNQGQTNFALSGGTYSGSVNYLPGGTYNIWGQYGGDQADGLSNSAKTQITVKPEASTTYFNIYDVANPAETGNVAVSSGSTNIPYGTQMILDAQAAPTSYYNQCLNTEIRPASCSTFYYTEPTGTVTFADNGSPINTAIINTEGDAEYNGLFGVGNHSVTVSYSGDQSYNASTGAPTSPITFGIAKDVPTLLLAGASAAVSTSGNYLGGGANTFTIQVENYANNASENQYGIGYVNSAAAPTGTVTVSGFPSGVPTSATLSAAVDPTTYFVEGVGTITAGASTPAGSYQVTVSYPGDANYTAVTQTFPVTIQAGGGLPSTTAAYMTGRISPTSSILVEGTVTGVSGHPAPTGYVLFFSSGYSLGGVGFGSQSGDVSDYAAQLDSQDLFQGTNLITVEYSGDSVYAPSSATLSPISSPLSDFTLLAQTTIIPVTAGNSQTDTIYLASVNGLSGAVKLTCSAAPGISCSIPQTESLSSGGNAAATLTISAPAETANQSYDVLVTGWDSTSSQIHTLGLEAVVSGSTAGSTSFALTNSGNITVSPGATTGNTATITATPLGGFTGTIGLSCSVTGPAGATSPATCGVVSPVTISGTSAETATLTVSTTSTTTTGSYAVLVTGVSGSLTLTTTVNVTVGSGSGGGGGNGAFAVSNSGNITVSPGANSGNTTTINVSPTGAFSGTVNLTCAISPTASSDPATCSLTPTSVNLSGGAAQTSILSVNTTGTTIALKQSRKLLWPSAGGGALAMALMFGMPARRRKGLVLLGLLVLVVSVACSGCSSIHGTIPTLGSGTPTGTYTVTVTGTSGSLTATTQVILTVN
ncbi:MAG: protease pro-enzyme activation domain-containing protein [Terracidiphilus sp.]|jgi:subtilase family serine protease